MDTHDVDEAITEFHEALRQKPGLSLAHYNLGVAMMAKSKPKEAAQEFRTFLKQTPDTPANAVLLERTRSILSALRPYEDQNGHH